MKYLIKQIIVTKPEVELPEGSIPVSVKHHSGYKYLDGLKKLPEVWQVIYLEPDVKEAKQ